MRRRSGRNSVEGLLVFSSGRSGVGGIGGGKAAKVPRATAAKDRVKRMVTMAMNLLRNWVQSDGQAQIRGAVKQRYVWEVAKRYVLGSCARLSVVERRLAKLPQKRTALSNFPKTVFANDRSRLLKLSRDNLETCASF